MTVREAVALPDFDNKGSNTKKCWTDLGCGPGSFTYARAEILPIPEYDSEISNRWEPYPVSFNLLTVLFKKAGYTSIIKIGEIPSIFRKANIYSALIKK